MGVMRFGLLFFLLLAGFVGCAQPESDTQLVLLNHEKVLARFRQGSIINFRLKKTEEFRTNLILEVREFSFVTTFDTVQFSDIGRISLKGHPNKSLFSLFGTAMMAAGAGYFIIDEANSLIVHGQGYDNDPGVWRPAVILVATGFVMRQIHKRSQRLRYPAKLLSAPKGSPFWRPAN